MQRLYIKRKLNFEKNVQMKQRNKTLTNFFFVFVSESSHYVRYVWLQLARNHDAVAFY